MFAIFVYLCLLTTQRPPGPSPTDPLCPYPTLFRSNLANVRQGFYPGNWLLLGNIISQHQYMLAVCMPKPVINAFMLHQTADKGKIGFLILNTILPGAIAASQLDRSEEHTSELQSLMRISYAVFCLKKKTSQLT